MLIGGQVQNSDLGFVLSYGNNVSASIMQAVVEALQPYPRGRRARSGFHGPVGVGSKLTGSGLLTNIGMIVSNPAYDSNTTNIQVSLARELESRAPFSRIEPPIEAPPHWVFVTLVRILQALGLSAIRGEGVQRHRVVVWTWVGLTLTQVFSNLAYHGTVVWSWQQVLMAAGLSKQLGLCGLSNNTQLEPLPGESITA